MQIWEWVLVKRSYDLQILKALKLISVPIWDHTVLPATHWHVLDPQKQNKIRNINISTTNNIAKRVSGWQVKLCDPI